MAVSSACKREDGIAAENADLVVPFKSDGFLQTVKVRIALTETIVSNVVR